MNNYNKTLIATVGFIWIVCNAFFLFNGERPGKNIINSKYLTIHCKNANIFFPI